MTTDNTQKLLNMKEEIDESKIKQSKVEGKREEVTDYLKKEFRCKTIKSAKQNEKDLDIEIEKEENILTKGINQLDKTIQEGEEK